MFTVKCTAVEKDILRTIATDGLEWYADLFKRKLTQYSRGAVEKALKRMLNKKLIHVKKREKLPSGIEQKWYDLTLLGLIQIFSDNSDIWDHIDRIAEKHADKLPLILGLWNYFKEQNFTEQIVSSMQTHFLVSRSCKGKIHINPLYLKLKPFWMQFENSLREELNYSILFECIWYGHPFISEQIGWIKVLTNHPLLKTYMKSKLARKELEFKERLRKVRLWKKHF